jgi:hypothetical protein
MMCFKLCHVILRLETYRASPLANKQPLHLVHQQ